jgi:hypothetical protein
MTMSNNLSIKEDLKIVSKKEKCKKSQRQKNKD